MIPENKTTKKHAVLYEFNQNFASECVKNLLPEGKGIIAATAKDDCVLAGS